MPDDDALDRLIADFLELDERGLQPDPAEWLARHPLHARGLADFFADLGRFGSFLGHPSRSTLDATTDLRPAVPAMDADRFGDYELLGEIGRGAMGVVHRARLKGTNLVVALKQVLPGKSEQADGRRFREEIEAVSGLRHPHLLPIFHVGDHGGRPYYTMALIEGGSMERLLPALRHDHRSAVALMTKVARAVHYAHQRRVLHRDLKPGNVLIDEAGEPHVADFGLAMKLDAEGEAAVDAPAGSLPWMAPEAVRGDKTVTTAVDVWALGVILYEALTGRRPFLGDDRNRLRKAILDTEPPTLRPIVDRDLNAIVLRCLAADPDERYESASALALDLDRWLRGEPVRARRSGPVELLLKWSRRHPAAASIALFAVGVVLASVLAAVRMANDQERRLREEVCASNEFAATHVASTLQTRLDVYGHLVSDASHDPELRRACAENDLPTVERVLRTLLEKPTGGPAFATTFVLDPNGVIVAEWPQTRKVVGENFAHRDYYIGPQTRMISSRAFPFYHTSKVFTSKNDLLDKLAVSTLMLVDDRRLWVVGATITADSTLGLTSLNDQRRKAVLLAPREGDGDHVVLVHPGYQPREATVVFPAERLHREGSRLLPEDDYRDPVAAVHPEYKGRWLAGFAPVPGTDMIVVVQQPYDEAVAPHRAFFNRFVEWIVGVMGLMGVVLAAVWIRRTRFAVVKKEGPGG